MRVTSSYIMAVGKLRHTCSTYKLRMVFRPSASIIVIIADPPSLRLCEAGTDHQLTTAHVRKRNSCDVLLKVVESRPTRISLGTVIPLLELGNNADCSQWGQRKTHVYKATGWLSQRRQLSACQWRKGQAAMEQRASCQIGKLSLGRVAFS